jgi:choline-phosphate cytidylyltransferase
MASLGMRFVPAVLLQMLQNSDTHITTLDVICDGLFLTVLTSDLTLAKMARRELHPWVVLMSLAAVLSHSVILILVATYYIAVFCDLCFYLNLPLLATCRNVYCDGVYDLCHIGHKRAFQKALALGNRLLVGVVNDHDASSYKRPPIMTHAERCQEVEACKAVSKVIPNAPCFGITQEFLDEHNIHVVAMGEEYLTRYPDPKDDPYYGYVREIGIAIPLPRTNTLSTTDLIERILKAGPVDKKSPT